MSRTLRGAGLLGRHRSAAAPAPADPIRSTRSRFGRRARTVTATLTAVASLGAAGQVALVATSSGASAATVAVQPLVSGRTLSGIIGSGGQSAVNSFASWRGKPVDVVVNYLGTSSWNAITNVSGEGLTKYWDGSSAHRVWTVPMLPMDGSASLTSEASGAYNDKFRTVAQALVAGGDGSSTIRLGWEMTGDWYPWSGVKNPSAYVNAWRQIVSTMRSVSGAHFTFDWNVSIGFANPEPMYPGDAYVDLIGADNYDSSWAVSYSPSDHANVWKHILNESWGLNWLGDFAKSHGKRLSFPEWGVEWRCDGHGGGDDPYFITSFHTWMTQHDVAYETVNNKDDNSCRKFQLTGGTFPNAANAYKAIMKGTTSTPPVSTPPTTTPPSSGTLSTSSVLVAPKADRTGYWELNNATINGPHYIFVTPPSSTTKVAFYLDRSTSSSANRTETSGPWDFSGTSANGNEYSWNASSAVGKGSHKLIVVATLASGATQTATVTFWTK